MSAPRQYPKMSTGVGADLKLNFTSTSFPTRPYHQNDHFHSDIPSDYELQAVNLLEKHTVDEVREFERKTRAEIEEKKEELRVMVGERYRDLIDAADTISEMTSCASHVVKSISSVESYCQTLRENFMVHGFSTLGVPQRRVKSEEQLFYGVTSQIKLLLEMPEKIWSAVEEGGMLQATNLYLLSRYIHSGLHLDATHSSSILYWFPVVSRQSSTINNFKTIILQTSKEIVKKLDGSNEQVTDALCAMLLLEDSSLQNLLDDFLSMRSAAIKQVLSTQNEASSIKDQICSVVSLLQRTIEQVYALFVSETSDCECNMVANKLKLTGTITCMEGGCLSLSDSPFIKCIPTAVIDYRPKVGEPDDSLDTSYIQETCQQWLDTMIQTLNEDISTLLEFVNCVKRLADVRDSIWTYFSELSTLSSWNTVCHCVLRHSLNIWTAVLQPLFLQRIHALVTYQLNSAAELVKRNIDQILSQIAENPDSIEHDLSEYIWTESASDLSSSAAWQTVAAKSVSSGGGLLMKTYGFTPAIQSLNTYFDGHLQVLLDDLAHYLEPEGSQATDSGAFDRYSDDSVLVEHLQSSSISCVEQVICHIDQLLKNYESELLHEYSHSQVTLIKILVLARFASSCCNLTTNLMATVLGPKPKDQRQLRNLLYVSVSKSQTNSTWDKVKDMWLECSLRAYRIWQSEVRKSLLEKFRIEMKSHTSQDTLHLLTQWEEVEISEDREDGQSMKSTIYIPMQSSFSLQQCLYATCCEINKVAGHTLLRSVLDDLIYSLTDGILEHVTTLVQDTTTPLTQNRALQLLFDVKFLLSVIPRKEQTEKNSAYHSLAKRLIEKLEDHVDPFDLDVFLPYIQSNLNRHARRAMVMYGSVISVERHSFHGQLSTTHQEQHSVMPVVSPPTRYALLPLSNTSINTTISVPLPPAKVPKLSSSASTQSLTASAEAVIESVTGSTQSLTQDAVGSFYNRIGSVSQIWFGNIGSKS